MDLLDKVLLENQEDSLFWRNYLENLSFKKHNSSSTPKNVGHFSRELDVHDLSNFGQDLDDGQILVIMISMSILILQRFDTEPISIETPLLNNSEGGLDTFIPIKSSYGGYDTLRDLLIQTQNHSKQCYLNQHLPLASLGYMNGRFSDLLLTFDKVHFDQISTDNHKFIFRISRIHQKITLNFEFSKSDLTTHEDELILRAFQRLFEIIHTFSLQDLICKIDLVDIPKSLYQRVDTKGLTDSTTALSILDGIVDLYPDKTAVFSDERNLSYRELDQLSNQLAAFLRKKYAVRENKLIGIMMGKSEWFVLSMLGILKAGGGYLPIDPEYPADRISYILKDSGIDLLIISSDFFFDMDWFSGELYAIDIQTDYQEESAEKPDYDISPDSIAYAIYTSGTTGKPKGILLEHRGLANLTLSHIQQYGIVADDCLFQFAPLSFDTSVSEIYMALCSGAGLVMSSKSVLVPKDFVACCKEYNVSVVTLPPAYLALAHGDGLEFLRVIISAGEKLNESLAKKLAGEVQFWNAYGPTEGTVCATVFQVPTNIEKSIPIGKSISGMQVYILASDGSLVPPNVQGEIVLSGPGVARGYLNNPELTAQKFIPNPFKMGEHMFKTGDFGCIDAEGNIHFIGRKDSQVKVSGFRIELGELERTLQKHEDIREAVVIKSGDNYDAVLIAYLTFDNKDIDIALVQKYISGVLPEYMMPRDFKVIDQFPLTPNRKIDRKALQNLSLSDDRKVAQPENEIERILVEIWCDVLQKEKVSVEDNFHEIGGNSLRSIKVISRLQHQLQIKIPMDTLLAKPVLRDFANELSKIKGDELQPIPLIEEQDYYDVSHGQRRLWILYQFENVGAAYHITDSYHIENLDVEIFQRSLAELSRRHESLRTVIVEVGNQPRQRVLSESNMIVPKVIDLPGGDAKDLNEIHREFINDPFQLDQGPLIRFGIIKTSEKDFYVISSMHHLISDGWSQGILSREVNVIYQGLKNKQDLELENVPFHYKEFSAYQNSFLNHEASDERDFWLGKFRGDLPTISLLTDYPRPVVKTYNGALLTTLSDKRSTKKLFNFGEELNATNFSVLVSCVTALLHRYTGQEDFILGTPVIGRNREDLESQIGFFVNTIPLRIEFSAEDTFKDLLEATRKVVNDGLKYQLYPFDKLVDELNLPRDLSRSPLFDVFVSYEKSELEDASVVSEDTEGINGVFRHSKFDLSFYFEHIGDELQLSIEYNTDLFHMETIKALGQHFHHLVNLLSSANNITLKSIDLNSEAAKAEKHEQFNSPRESLEHESILGLIAKQSLSTPEAIAIQYKDDFLTYKELDEYSNQWGHYLIEKGVKPGIVVGVMLERSLFMPVILLGIIKVGGVYMPLDSDHPDERNLYQLEDSKAAFLISDQPFAFDWSGQIMFVSEEIPTVYSAAKLPVPHQVKGTDNIYILYTSGSTGKPKGVLLHHLGILNRLVWMKDFLEIHKKDVFLQKTSYTFDHSVWELFIPLCYGAVQVQCDRDEIYEPERIIELIKRHQVTIIHFVAGMLSSFLERTNDDDLKSLRSVIQGGEALPLSTSKLFYRRFPGVDLYNFYGPTEASIDVSACKVEPTADRISIGKPIRNAELYILDAEHKLQPTGVIGEIAASGVGLAKGYINNSRKTNQSFIEHPFKPGERLYLTGDLGRWLRDGSIECLGRKDNQVKINGFRIELGEIESTLLDCPGVEQAIAQMKGEGVHAQLLCYLTGSGWTEQEVKENLAKRLPAYMIPGIFIRLDGIPLLPSGKLDRKQLAALEVEHVDENREYVAPNTDLEKHMVAIWEEVLNRKQVGITDDFFDLGGDSIKAIRVGSRLFKEGYRVSIGQIFEFLTIKMICQHVNPVSEIADQNSITGQLPLTPIQMSFFNHKELWKYNYNQSLNLKFNSGTDSDMVRNAIKMIVSHHDGLRVTFEVGKEGIIATNHDVDFNLDFEELNVQSLQKLEQVVQATAQRVRLDGSSLMKSLFFRLPNENRLVILFHHLIVDVVSMTIFMEDLKFLLETNGLLPLPLKTTSYKKWAETLVEYVDNEGLDEAIDYWSNVCRADAKVFDSDTIDPHSIEKGTSSVSFNLDEKYSGMLLSDAHKAMNTQVVDLLMSALSLAISRHTTKEKFLVLMEGHGREDIFPGVDVNRTIGWFTTEYPVLMDHTYVHDIKRHIKEIKQQLRVPKKGIEFGILRYLHGQKNECFDKTFQIRFNYLGQFESDQEDDDSIFEIVDDLNVQNISDSGPIPYPIEIICAFNEGQFTLEIIFDNHQLQLENMNKLLMDVKVKLEETLDFCLSMEETELTPSDLSHDDMSVSELESLQALFNQKKS